MATHIFRTSKGGYEEFDSKKALDQYVSEVEDLLAERGISWTTESSGE